MISAIKNIRKVFSQNGGGSGGGSNLEIKDEGSTLTAAATSIDFIGDAVTATAVGTAVTVNVTGGGVAASTNNLFAYYNFI